MKAWLKKMHHQGYLAEFLAAMTLRLKGYRILEYRYKTPLGEIDLLAIKKGTLIAVEVKYRSTLEQASQAITSRQQKRIENALMFYLKTLKRQPRNIRFDAVLLIPYKWPKHIISAWISKN